METVERLIQEVALAIETENAAMAAHKATAEVLNRAKNRRFQLDQDLNAAITDEVNARRGTRAQRMKPTGPAVGQGDTVSQEETKAGSELSEVVRVPKKGERWDTTHGIYTVRVMADPIEGYVMVRRNGGMPFLVHVNDWHKNFVIKPKP